ncbi:hypothetical protein ACIP6P_22845 [Streptomyces sp. NPDC088729]|uniref:hypothetical protein n=1 Tax=Streptomyces sp. NPDC088729 TaxID=3365876 RepID=UPI0037F3197D
MSTTRHLVNRRRRLTTAPPRSASATEPQDAPSRIGDAPEKAGGPGTSGEGPHPVAGSGDDSVNGDEAARGAEAEAAVAAEEGSRAASASAVRRFAARLRVGLPAMLCVLTVVLGAFAVWAFTSAASLRGEPARQNTALTDIARTSEVKGRISEAVGAVFSYDYASPARSDRAARTYLTGRAVEQHRGMLAEVRAQAPKQKLVLTTTVTESAVEFLDGDRARLLIFADQSNTRTGKNEETTYAAAMFAVDAVHRQGAWRIAAIDTFTR